MSGRLQVYETPELRVTFDPGRCIHSAECVRALPSVFDPRQRQWVRLENASADVVAAAVNRCPTGALQATRPAAAVPDPADSDPAAPDPGTQAAVVIRLADHGPLLVRGRVRIVDAAGGLVAEEDRVALCRCGRSGNAPFCDGSHARAGFTPAR